MIHAFEFKNMYLVLDVESGALHSVDKQAFDVIRALENNDDPTLLPYEKHQIAEIIDELALLRSEGSFDMPAPEAPDITNSQVIKSMCLNVTHDCNLRCKYCFASTGDFHGTRMLMSEEVGRRALDFLIARSGSRKHLEVDFFGGEPMMNFEVVKALVKYGRALEKQFNKQINFTITTNCVLLDDESIDFINQQMHNVVLSIDGREHIHDAMRPTVNNKGSYGIVLKNAQAMVAARGNKEYYVRGTYTNKNLDFARDVEALYEAGFDQISLEPVVLDEKDPYALTKAHLPEICAQYDLLAEMIINKRESGHWFNFFHFMVDLAQGPCLKKRIMGCAAGNEYVAVAPDGNIYPCHQFVGETEYCMGNVLDSSFNQEIQAAFKSCSILNKPECQNCWAKYFCSGGCAANAYKYNKNIHIPYEISCVLEKKRTECAIGIFAYEKGKQVNG